MSVKKGDRLGVRGPVTERPWTCRDGVERTEEIVTAWVLHLHRRPRPGTGEEGREAPTPLFPLGHVVAMITITHLHHDGTLSIVPRDGEPGPACR